ncbi:OsmC family protein [Lactiplantibacillus songbeiensis]|uniref:OsmC family protein n=1 Tax=Lactiplantibacillus songbeiensis TaxID=2559920 RepID=A0ABW4C1N1_9LACO|nr:OsmC family protein [Lactiplantibacillus songbeiensis]
MADYPSLYTTQAINVDGLQGESCVPNGLTVPVSSPLSAAPGTNPEQLIGLALSTCLNATLEQIEKEQQVIHQSTVVTTVKLSRDQQGYQFVVDATVTIPEVDQATAAAWLELAEARCPVAKLLAGSANVTIYL